MVYIGTIALSGFGLQSLSLSREDPEFESRGHSKGRMRPLTAQLLFKSLPH
jgi:hypothetical protein